MAVPSTRARLSHALTLRSGGVVIGAIHQWAPAMSRDVEPEFEIDANGYGLPVDQVPQAVTRREIRISRYDTYPLLMEEVFGTAELVTLADQARPFSVRESWKGPGVNPLGEANNAVGGAVGGFGSLAGNLGLSGLANTANSAAAAASGAISSAAASKVGRPIITALGFLTADTRVYEYTGCYFTDLGRTLDARGDRVVSVDATLTWLGRRRVA